MQLGTAKVDITPDKPIPLAGYSHRKGPYDAINRRMQLRVNCFQQEASGETRHLLVVQLMPGCKVGIYSIVGSGVILEEDVPNRTAVYQKQELIRREWGPEQYGW